MSPARSRVHAHHPLRCQFRAAGRERRWQVHPGRLLLGFIAPTGDALSVLGTTPAGAHPRVGYLHERTIFQPRFSGREHLTYLAALSGLHGPDASARLESLLDLVHLSPAACRRSAHERVLEGHA